MGSITKHQSEWVKDMHSWRYIEKHIPDETRFDWEYTKTKIANYAWWDEVKTKVKGFPQGDAFYFHPAGFVGNFLGGCCDSSNSYIYKTIEGDFCFSKSKLDWLMHHEGFRKYPYIPGVASGITLGYGYDLGHQTKQQARIDLLKYYSESDVKKLLNVVGLTQQSARNKLTTVSSVRISKDGAKRMLIDLLGRYAKQVVSTFPEIINLHPFCQVAMVSLVYNRGARTATARRLEMKNIQSFLRKGEYHKIPNEFIKMKRLWVNNKNARGLLRRRDEEASLFKEGLKNGC